MTTYKITTWNVNSLKVRQPQVLQFLADQKPSVLCVQELKMADQDIKVQDFIDAGYNIDTFGQKAYNGVATIWEKDLGELADVDKNIPGFADPQSRLLAGTVKMADKDIRIVNGYFPNGEAPGSDKFPYKLAWLDALAQWLKGELEKYPYLVLLGDYNIAPTDADVKHPEEWADTVLCVPEVRERFQNLLDLGLVDSFRQHDQPEKLYSWWDYRLKAFQRNLGLRIDHILISKNLAPYNQSVVINKEYRGLERPSDHAPVTLTLDFQA